jgi:hypothetical protein
MKRSPRLILFGKKKEKNENVMGMKRKEKIQSWTFDDAVFFFFFFFFGISRRCNLLIQFIRQSFILLIDSSKIQK